MWEEGIRIYGTPGVYNNFPNLEHIKMREREREFKGLT